VQEGKRQRNPFGKSAGMQESREAEIIHQIRGRGGLRTGFEMAGGIPASGRSRGAKDKKNSRGARTETVVEESKGIAGRRAG